MRVWLCHHDPQRHDEHVLGAPEAAAAAVSDLVSEEVRRVLPLDGVPIVVDVGVADNWLDAH